MAHSLSAKKRVRQNETNRVDNKSTRSRLKALAKKVREAVAENRLDEAEGLLKQTFKLYDQAAAKDVIHDNAAARFKSRLSMLVQRARAKA